MSGLPGTNREATLPAWSVLPWDSAYLDARDYQWNEELDPLDGLRHAAQTLLEAPRTVDPTDPSDLRRHAGFPVRGSTEW